LIIPTLGWRALFVVGVVPAVLLFFVCRYMPESVRYLLSKGRVADAEKIVADIEQRALGRSLTVEEIKAAPKVKPEVAVPTGVTVFELFTPGRAPRLFWSGSSHSGSCGPQTAFCSCCPQS